MSHSFHGEIEKYEDAGTEARRLYKQYQPFPWWEPIERKGPFALSMIICSVLVGAMFNGAFFKEAIVERMLWVSSAICTMLFFVYLAAKVVLERKKSKLFAVRYPRSVRWL